MMRKGKEGGKIPPNLTLYSEANSTVFIAENFKFFILKIFLNMSTLRNVLPNDDYINTCLFCLPVANIYAEINLFPNMLKIAKF